MTALRVMGLDVPFGTERGLEGVAFDVAPGERFVLVGASGAGKTSLLGALAGTVTPSAGRVYIAGAEVTRLPVERRPCVLMAQTPLLFPHLSVFENVAFPLRVRRFPSREVGERVRAVLAAVLMHGFEGRYPSTLSGGQSRRVALARAVVARPPLLLLDEPLSALDPSLREEVRRAIVELHADYRPALVLVTHDLTEAGRFADRIGVVAGGGLAQVGSPEQIFRRPATLAVARLLGLSNDLQGESDADGTLRIAGVAVLGSTPPSGPRAGPVRVVFGVDGAELCVERSRLPTDGSWFTGQVSGMMHGPDGAIVQVGTELGVIEVRAAPGCLPDRGEIVSLRLRRDSVHVFEE